MSFEKNSDQGGVNGTEIARSAFKVMAGGLITLIAGLASQVVIASFFGAGKEMDAFLTALAVPVYLEAVLLGGLSFVIIPAFIKRRMQNREDEAWALVGTFFWLTLGVMSLVAIVGSLAAQGIIRLSAPGLNPAKSDLAAGLLAILMISVPFTGAATFTAGIQNARNRFFSPAVAPAIGSLGNVIVLLLLFERLGPISLAWGFLVSAALRAGVTVVPVWNHGWKRLIPLNDGRVLEMLRLMAPIVFFGLLTRSTLLFERYFASSLPDGDLSYLGYAFKVSSIAVALLAEGIAAAILPSMSSTYVTSGDVGLAETAEYGLRLSLAAALPVLAILSAAAIPLITILYERGAFQRIDTVNVSRIIAVVILGDVIFRMLGNVLGRAFYVTKDTRTVPVVATLTAVIYLLLASRLASLWGYVGLAWANSLMVGTTVVVLSWLLARRLKQFKVRGLINSLMAYSAASLAAYAGASASLIALRSMPTVVQLLGAFVCGGLPYLFVLHRLDRGMARSILVLTGVRQVAIRVGINRS